MEPSEQINSFTQSSTPTSNNADRLMEYLSPNLNSQSTSSSTSDACMEDCPNGESQNSSYICYDNFDKLLLEDTATSEVLMRNQLNYNKLLSGFGDEPAEDEYKPDGEPFVKIIEEPASNLYRFRYGSEGETAGSIPGHQHGLQS